VTKLAIAIGSVWTVPLVGGKVVITAGPFGSSQHPEYLVIPVYSSREPRFSRSRLDVEIVVEEGPFDRRMFASVWNARPVLTSDLELNLGVLSTSAIEAIRDVYWTTLNGERLGNDKRLGKFQLLRRGRIVRFQEAELRRWRVLSGRVWQHEPALNAMAPGWKTDLEESWSQFGAEINVITHEAVEGTPEFWSSLTTSWKSSIAVKELREVREISDGILPSQVATNPLGASVSFSVSPRFPHEIHNVDAIWWQDAICAPEMNFAVSDLAPQPVRDETILAAAGNDLALAA
jgi:hypothetical protein